MRFSLSTQVIQHNLKLLKRLITLAKKQHKDSSFDLYIDKTTGLLAKTLKKSSSDSNWEEVLVKWDKKSTADLGKFTISRKHNRPLDRESYSQLESVINVVNAFFQRTPSKTRQHVMENPLFEKAFYGSINRTEAETLLDGHKTGTFLFRIDPCATILEEELCFECGDEICCVTLAIAKEGGGVSEYILVQKDGLLQIYNDDPSLDGATVFSIEDLLQKVGALYPKTKES